MTKIEKHQAYFIFILSELNEKKQPNDIRQIVRTLMQYLEDEHLIDKNYLNHNELFVKCESNPDLIETLDAEMMLSFLTMIYRIDFIAADSDAYMIYFNNGLLIRILKHLILRLDI